MRKAAFAVPSEVIAEFADEMTNMKLENTVVGTNEENEILVEVMYEKEESKEVDALEEFLDDLREQLAKENEEEEEEGK